jgi:hypothetical protein
LIEKVSQRDPTFDADDSIDVLNRIKTPAKTKQNKVQVA